MVLQEARPQSDECIRETNGRPSHEAPMRSVDRAGLGGGPGLYKVVKTGPSGHNIRSCPNLRGIPIGMLVLGNKVKAVGEVWTPTCVLLAASKSLRCQISCLISSAAVTVIAVSFSSSCPLRFPFKETIHYKLLVWMCDHSLKFLHTKVEVKPAWLQLLLLL